MGGAYVGVANDSTAIFHNPAAMTLIKGRHMGLGMDALLTDEHYTPPSLPKESAKSEFLPVPQFGFVDGRRKVAWGFGVFFPHGNGGKFSTPSSVPSNPNEGRIYSMEIDPAVAYEILPGLSIGATLRIVRVSSTLKGQLIPLPPPFPPATFDTIDNLHVSGYGIGGSFGALYKPCSHFSFGVNYRSKVKAELDGSADLATNGTLTVHYNQNLPTLVTAGIGYYPIDGLTLAASYDFERNSENKTINATLNGVIPFTFPQGFRDSHTIHVGGEYWVFPTIAFRAGYAKDFSESVPDTTMDRILGDIAAHEVSSGLSYKWDRYTLAATWNARFGTRNITSGSAKAPGKYQAFVQMVSLGVEAAY